MAKRTAKVRQLPGYFKHVQLERSAAKRFVADLQDVMPGQYQRFKRTRKALEQVYEETIQLQIDFGTRIQKGLTLHWFQVFIQKAARKAGLSVTGLLVALLDDLQS